MESIVSNAIAFNGPTHPLALVAKDLQAVVHHVQDAVSSDVQRDYVILSRMRLQLSSNMRVLHNDERLEVLKFMRQWCPHSLDQADGQVTGVMLDMLDFKSFVYVDACVRGHLVRRKRGRAAKESEPTEGEATV